jgi:DNA-binding XRE family transcriptional regulator
MESALRSFLDAGSIPRAGKPPGRDRSTLSVVGQVSTPVRINKNQELRHNGKRWGTRRKEYWETRSSGAIWFSAGCVTSRIPNMANDNVELLRLGRRIQAERKLLGLTQNGFARDCGLNRSHFAGIERGERNLTFAVLCKICKRLSCDIANVTRGIPRSSYVHDP